MQEIRGLRSELRSEVRDLRSAINTRFDSVQRAMREFYAGQATQDVRLAKLEQSA